MGLVESFLNRGGHPLATSSESGHGWSAFSDGGSWSLGVEAREWMGRGRRRQGEVYEGILFLLQEEFPDIKGVVNVLL